MKPVIRNVLAALGLLPLSVFADNAVESVNHETSSQSSAEQTWGSIERWISEGEKESLLSDYFIQYEPINEFVLSLDSAAATPAGHLSTISTSSNNASVSHPMTITSITESQHGSVSVVTPGSMSSVSIQLSKHATTFITTTQQAITIVSTSAPMTIETKAGNKTTITQGVSYTITANTTIKIITNSATTINSSKSAAKLLVKVISAAHSSISVTSTVTHKNAVTSKVSASHGARTVTNTSGASQTNSTLYAPKSFANSQNSSLQSPFLGAVQPNNYSGQANITGMYGSQNSSYAEADFWQPIWQEYDRVVFGDIRGIKGEGSQWEGNAGAGYRWLAFDDQILFGAYSFYDYKNSALNNAFEQVTFGAEVKTLNWTGRGNYYLPIGPTQARTYDFDAWEWSAVNANGYQNLLISNGYEYSLGGFDAEVGRLIPGVAGLTTYAGMFYFTNSQLGETLVGPRLRVEYDLAKVAAIPLTWANGWVKNAQIEGSWQYDDIRGNIWSVGLQLSIPFSNKKTISSNDLTSRMTEYVRRDVNVVTIQNNGDFTPYEQNGVVWEFAQINSSEQFNTELGKTIKPNVYLIQANVTTDKGDIQLGDNLTMTGGRFEYETGHYLVVQSTVNKPSITAPANADLFVLGKNNTITDLNLVVTSDKSVHRVLKNKGVDTSFAKTISGVSVGKLTIDNITANGGILVAVQDNTHDTQVSIINSTFNMSSTTGSHNAAIDLEAWNNTQMTVSQVSGNTITFGDEVKDGKGISFYVDKASTQLISNVNKNAVTFGKNAGADKTGSGAAAGIAFTNLGTQTITNVNNNNVAFGAKAGAKGGDLVYGIDFINTTGIQAITSANGNIIVFSDNAGYDLGAVTGMLFKNNGAQQTVTSASENQVSFGNIAINSYAILFENNSNTQTLTSVNSNKITFGKQATNFSTGIYFYNTSGNQNVTSANSNVVTFGADVGAEFGKYGYGIYFFNNGTQQTITSVDSNTVTFGDNVTNDYGIYFVNAGTQQTIDSINGNAVTFGNAAGNTVGISFNNTGEQNITGGIDNNTIIFGTGAGTNGTSQGIGFADGGSTSTFNMASLNGNTIKFRANVVNADGIYFSNAGTTTINDMINNAVSGALVGRGVYMINAKTFNLYINGNPSGTNVATDKQAAVLQKYNAGISAKDITINGTVKMTE